MQGRKVTPRADNQYFVISGQYIWAGCRLPRKSHLAVKFPLEIHPGLYIALICGAQLIFSCMSLTDRPICRQIVIHKSQSARKGGCQRTATRTYLHWLQFIFRASEWVNSYFTLLNVPLCQMRNTKWWIKTFHIFILTWSFGLFGYICTFVIHPDVRVGSRITLLCWKWNLCPALTVLISPHQKTILSSTSPEKVDGGQRGNQPTNQAV